MADEKPTLGKQIRTGVAVVGAAVSGAAHQPGTVNTSDLNSSENTRRKEEQSVNERDTDAQNYRHGS